MLRIDRRGSDRWLADEGPSALPEDKMSEDPFNSSPDLPQRKILYHRPPSWVESSALFFVTVCCQQRGTNLLCVPEAAAIILNAAEYYHAHKRWYLALMVLMPDHVHAIVALPPYEEMSRVIRSWKIYTSRETRVRWQRDFFDHRLRRDESFEQKATYILENPVRAGLVRSADDWRFKAGAMLHNDGLR